jgi:hypothetical protein
MERAAGAREAADLVYARAFESTAAATTLGGGLEQKAWDWEDVPLPNKALAEAALAAQAWSAMNRKRAAQPEAVKAGREAESLRSEYGAT